MSRFLRTSYFRPYAIEEKSIPSVALLPDAKADYDANPVPAPKSGLRTKLSSFLKSAPGTSKSRHLVGSHLLFHVKRL